MPGNGGQRLIGRVGAVPHNGKHIVMLARMKTDRLAAVVGWLGKGVGGADGPMLLTGAVQMVAKV